MDEQEKKYCMLWHEARNKALERGFDMSPRCPLEDVCTGEKCIFIDPKGKKGIIYQSPTKHPNEPITGC